MKNIQNIFYNKLIDIASLVSFRILFGFLVLVGLMWSIGKGDIQNRYWKPNFFFDYYGFEYLPYVGDLGIVIIYIFALIGALGIMLGLFYRWSVFLFTISFSYLHTIDATNFINHYYLIWIFGFYLFFLPANRAFSLDVFWRKKVELGKIPYAYVWVLQFQLMLVYLYAGIAKLNPDWIQSAMPLKIWLLQRTNFPIIGFLFKENWVHYAASWIAAFYDLSIAFLLCWRPSRRIAYFAVLGFHLLTGLLFNIGLFPLLMISSTLIFFSPQWHRSIQNKLKMPTASINVWGASNYTKYKNSLLLLFLFAQIILPIRHVFLGGYQLMWRQEYMRYGWRVMLVEHEGNALFRVYSKEDQRVWEVNLNNFLTPYQIKRMAVQPEHLRQFAHHLADTYQEKYNLTKRPLVKVEASVSMNGQLSQLLIDPDIDLANAQASIFPQKWILDFHP